MEYNQILEKSKQYTDETNQSIFFTEDFKSFLKSSYDNFQTKSNELFSSYKRYKKERLKIQNRVKPQITQNCIKYDNNFRFFSVKQLSSYILGNAVDVIIENEELSDELKKNVSDQIEYYKKRNSWDDKNLTLSDYAGATGYGVKLLYQDIDLNDKTIIIPSYECFFLEEYDETYGVARYINKEIRIEKELATFIEYEYYTNNFIIKMDKDDNITVTPHFYFKIPIIKFKNNDEEVSDFYFAESLLDIRDNFNSDFFEDLAKFANAYLTVTGTKIEEKDVEKIKESGVLQSIAENAKYNFLTKNLDVNVYERTKKLLDKDIFLFLNIVDFADEDFSGTTSGEARKWKLQALTNKAILKENKFTSGFRKEFECLINKWNFKNEKEFNYLDIGFVFSRNLPVDLEYYANLAVTLKGAISDESRIRLLPFIEDTQEELLRLKESKEVVNNFSENNENIENENNLEDK